MVQVVDESDLILINGCLCCNLSLYADCPECIGASCKGELLCCVQRFCFKFGVPPLTCCESPREILSRVSSGFGNTAVPHRRVLRRQGGLLPGGLVLLRDRRQVSLDVHQAPGPVLLHR